MRTRLSWLAAGLLLAAGCGTTADTAPVTPEDEKAAELRLKEEAARERKARQQEQKEKKGQKANPDD